MNYIFFYSHTKQNAFVIDANLKFHSIDLRVLSNLFVYNREFPTSEAVYQSQKVDEKHQADFLKMLQMCDKIDPKITAHLGQARGITIEEFEKLSFGTDVPDFLDIFNDILRGGITKIRAKARKDFDGWSAMWKALQMKKKNGAFNSLHPMSNSVFIEWTELDSIWATHLNGAGTNWLGIQLTALFNGVEPVKPTGSFQIPSDVLKVVSENKEHWNK